MVIFETYSRRKRRAEQGEPEVYQYDHVPREVRIQTRHILREALGRWEMSPASQSFAIDHNRFLNELRRILLKEKAVLERLSTKPTRSRYIHPKEDILEAVTDDFPNVNDWLDVVEICFWAIDCSLRRLSESGRKARGIEQDPDDAIEELNARFRETGFGYQFEAGRIVRVDSQLLHSEVVKPALVLLADPRFKGAQDEFLSAHAHYRAGEHEAAIVEANKAFESTMKAICDIKGEGWNYPNGARASELIKIIRRNRLLPDYLDQSFDQLISTLQSGLPKVRNEVGGHGQGATPRETPGYIAAYALHLAASKIVLLVEALKATGSIPTA